MVKVVCLPLCAHDYVLFIASASVGGELVSLADAKADAKTATSDWHFGILNSQPWGQTNACSSLPVQGSGAAAGQQPRLH